MSDKRRYYDKAFKLETVRPIANLGRSIRDASKDLGISDKTLYSWGRTYRQDPEHCFPGRGCLKSADDGRG